MRELLETFENKNKGKQFVCEHTFPELTAVCPTTQLPDFYTLRLLYEPNEKIIELKSLKLYLVGYRNEGIYHEELINKIMEDLKTVIEPNWIFIELEVAVRGGISTSVRRFWDKDEGDDIERAIEGI
ncbi:MAG: preQ(1) synthase [Candidatus Hodarchaeota archaeon]